MADYPDDVDDLPLVQMAPPKAQKPIVAAPKPAPLPPKPKGRPKKGAAKNPPSVTPLPPSPPSQPLSVSSDSDSDFSSEDDVVILPPQPVPKELTEPKEKEKAEEVNYPTPPASPAPLPYSLADIGEDVANAALEHDRSEAIEELEKKEDAEFDERLITDELERRWALLESQMIARQRQLEDAYEKAIPLEYVIGMVTGASMMVLARRVMALLG